MMEAMVNSNSVNGGGDCSEEELSVLPRHTKVVVTGNNRTKSVLVGLQGVVKKAVGLGGWHWLVLTNGIEVKLQRNALSVIEPPSGHEEDDEMDYESMQWNGSEIASCDLQKLQKPRQKPHKIAGIHKALVHSHSYDPPFKRSTTTSKSVMKVDFSKLEITALRRYWRHFNLMDADSNPSKEKLIDAVQRHFKSQQLDELQVIIGFVQAAKRLKTVCS